MMSMSNESVFEMPEGHFVELTTKAAQMIKSTFTEQGIEADAQYLRIGAQKGGCSGYKYDLQPAALHEVTGADSIFESEGIKLVVDKDCLNNVLGSVRIDFQNEGMIGRGFKFERLTTGAMCGCGESFSPVLPPA